MKRTKQSVVALATVLAACQASTPGAKPEDMSVAGHEAAGAEHANLAQGHASEYQPGAEAEQTSCRQGTPKTGEVCWTSKVNPTAQHDSDAALHRKHAADHRAASEALKNAETQACVGIPEEDRDTSPFAHKEDIENVKPLIEREGKQQTERTAGAIVTFRAVPGMTAEWLQRVVDCHLARNAALGHTDDEMPYCPLVPKGARATVSSTGSGFQVAVRGADAASAQALLTRAEKLR
jgi:hypothetical protein